MDSFTCFGISFSFYVDTYFAFIFEAPLNIFEAMCVRACTVSAQNAYIKDPNQLEQIKIKCALLDGNSFISSILSTKS